MLHVTLQLQELKPGADGHHSGPPVRPHPYILHNVCLLFIFFKHCLITEFFSTRNKALSVSIIESVIKSPLQVP